MDGLLINKKKIGEFSKFMNSKNRRILVLMGPPGCGKNAMLNAYAKDNNMDLHRFTYKRSLLSNGNIK